MNNDTSKVNTVLLVLLLLVVVGGLVWFFATRKPKMPERSNEAGIDIQVNMPENSDTNGR